MRLALAVFLVALGPATLSAQEKPKGLGAKYERANKMWDERLSRMLRAHIEAQCKDEAKKAYSAIRFNKRRKFLDDCVSKATTAAAAPASHQAN